MFAAKPFLQRIMPKVAHLLPGVLMTLVIIIFVAYVLKLNVEYVTLDTKIDGWRDSVML